MTVRVAEATAAMVGVMLIGKFILWPLIRTGSIGTDGMLLFNFILLWWADPIDNYMNFSFMYNGYALNMGSWASFIPGVSYPNQQNFAEPLLMMGGFYLGYFMINTLIGCWVMRKMHALRSDLSFGTRMAVLFIVLSMIDLIVENAIMRTGIAAYPGVMRSLSLFPGKVYQWPLYEAPIIGFVVTGFVCLRYFRDDRGLTFVEKGIDQLGISGTSRKLVTFLALAGFLQPFFLIAYFLPYNFFVIHADTFPAYPSYLRTEICGEGTQYACPSREWVPIPTRDSKLSVHPDDPRLPSDVRNAQGISASGRDPYASN